MDLCILAQFGLYRKNTDGKQISEKEENEKLSTAINSNEQEEEIEE